MRQNAFRVRLHLAARSSSKIRFDANNKFIQREKPSWNSIIRCELHRSIVSHSNHHLFRRVQKKVTLSAHSKLMTYLHSTCIHRWHTGTPCFFEMNDETHGWLNFSIVVFGKIHIEHDWLQRTYDAINGTDLGVVFARFSVRFFVSFSERTHGARL